MSRVPAPALALNLAGLVPFVWGVLTVLSDGASEFGMSTFGPRFIGPYVQNIYGALILSLMSGVYWSFSLAAGGAAAVRFSLLAILPVAWAFVMVGGGPVAAATYLAIGFVGTLALDWVFWQARLAPGWWMELRLPITAIILLCLVVTALA
jgi:multidrug transporter EmrE-like cation transporter